MAEHWSTEYLRCIKDCEDRESRLNDWSRGFVDSLRARIEGGKQPTKNQIEKLDEIWESATARG